MRLKLKVGLPLLKQNMMKVSRKIQELINADKEINNQLEEKKIIIHRCGNRKSQAQKHDFQL